MSLNGLKYIMKEPKFILYYIDKYLKIRISDKTYLEILYKKIFNKELDLDNPKTFNEKLQWLKLYDRNSQYTEMVDKYQVKKYIADLIGEGYIIPTLGIYDKFDEIDFDKLPNQFVLKCTHDSGSTVICRDKNYFDYKLARKKIEKALKRNFFYGGREWPYKNVKPKIIIEKYMEDNEQSELRDYKLMCFNGKVKCSFVCSERYSESGLKIDIYDLEWKKMEVKRNHPNSSIEIAKPKNYEIMIELAEKLSKGIPFVRVDFYEIEGKLYFGELTFFPGSGLTEFIPEKYDNILGDMLELPREKREKNEK